jgi:pimeloyl-ACP methyl ester carboxylesterase
VRGPRAHELGLTAAGLGAWLVRLAADHRAIRRDPLHTLLHKPLEGRARSVTSSDGTPLHVMEFGAPDAPATVVLVHGWTCALKIWTPIIRALAGDEMRVIAYDLRGHARSGRPEENDYSIDAHAGDLDAVLRATLSDGQRAIVVGHSLGGMTIVAWAGDHAEDVPHLVAGAVLVNTGVDGLIAQSPILKMPEKLGKAREIVGRALLSTPVPLPHGPTPLSFRVVRWIGMTKSASPAQVAFCERLVLACKRDVRALCGGTLSGIDLYESIASLGVPTVIIGGEEDKLTPPSHVRRLADALPHVVEKIVIEDCGHMGPISHPERIAWPIVRLVRDHAHRPVEEAVDEAERVVEDEDPQQIAEREAAAAT